MSNVNVEVRREGVTPPQIRPVIVVTREMRDRFFRERMSRRNETNDEIIACARQLIASGRSRLSQLLESSYLIGHVNRRNRAQHGSILPDFAQFWTCLSVSAISTRIDIFVLIYSTTLREMVFPRV